ncbi:hypothetical protein BHK69_18835 [Bosea vaviloviae]|uniref:Uncharacterized protein n=1 Tax=Bosea vaviloviae TaxID=1526658 RepID=A0A1D7U4C9_9HYPH|nr:hypothetical protein BHK69_18835 [Bosea vaviloviae]
MRCQSYDRGLAAQPPGQPWLRLDCSRDEDSNGCKIGTQYDPAIICASAIEIVQEMLDRVTLSATQHGFDHGAFLARQDVEVSSRQ